MLRLVDVSRYQVERADPLDLAKAKAAGYQIINVALTGGRGYVSGSWAATYLNRASALGLGRSTYHWLDGRTSGTSQAMLQLERMRSLFGPALAGFAHFVDVEEDGKNGITPPTWAHVRDYVTVVQAALRRPIGIYSADYWWQPRAWNGAGLTPYLMGPPNTPIGRTPDDDSSAWSAGWGGWPDFSVLQWGVQPLPGTGDCSLSVIRDHAMWAALTGGDVIVEPLSAASWVLVPCLISLRDEFNRLAPSRDKASDGSIGDAAHAGESSDHNPDETGTTPYEDADRINEVHAIDVDKDLTGSPLTMEQCVQIIAARHRSGADDRLQNVIFNRRIWSRSWGWTQRDYTTGSNPHDRHAHFSARYTTEQENDTGPWGLLEEDDDMATISQTDFNARMDTWWNARMSPGAAENGQRSALRVAPWHQKIGRTETNTYDVFVEMRANLRIIAETLNTLMAKASEDDAELAELKAFIDQQLAEAAQDVVAGMAASDTGTDEIAEALRAALGDRADDVAREILAGTVPA
jgi:glycosyl hydrolase family 25